MCESGGGVVGLVQRGARRPGAGKESGNHVHRRLGATAFHLRLNGSGVETLTRLLSLPLLSLSFPFLLVGAGEERGDLEAESPLRLALPRLALAPAVL